MTVREWRTRVTVESYGSVRRVTAEDFEGQRRLDQVHQLSQMTMSWTL